MGRYASIHPYLYEYDDDAYFDRPSLTAALAGKKSHRHRHRHHPPTHPPTIVVRACVYGVCVCVCVCVCGALSLSPCMKLA